MVDRVPYTRHAAFHGPSVWLACTTAARTTVRLVAGSNNRSHFVGTRFAICLVVALVCAFRPVSLLAAWPVELSRLPDAPNAIGLIDLAALRDLADRGSPDAATMAALLASLPVAESANLQQLLLVSQLDFDSLDPIWEIALAQTTHPLDLADIAKTEDGYLDRVGKRDVAWSPRNVYFLATPDRQVVAVRPANRQLLARWLRSLGEKEYSPLGPFLTSVTRYSTTDIPVFLAIECVGAISSIPAREKLATIDGLNASDADLDALAKLAGDLVGLYFAVQSKAALTGKLQLEFASSPEILLKHGKLVVSRVLEAHGIAIDGLGDWKVRVEGNTYSLTGPLSLASLADVLGVLRSPGLVSSMVESQSLRDSTESQSDVEKQAAASKRYFDSVRRVVKDVRDFSAKTPGNQAGHNDRAARRINDLPILKVDPQLIDFGMTTANLLREAAMGSRGASMKAGVARAGSSNNSYYASYYGYGGGMINAPNYALMQSNAQARATSGQFHLSALDQIDELTAQVRRAMTEKYQIEF